MTAFKVDFLTVSFLMITGTNIFAVFGSICICIYYLSMLKQNVVNKTHNRSWWQYFKSWFSRK